MADAVESANAEEIKKEEPKKEQNENLDEIPIFEKAKAEADRLEAANKKTEELIKRQEKLLAEIEIRGRGMAGKPIEKTEQDKILDEVDVLLKPYGVDVRNPNHVVGNILETEKRS